MENNLNNRLYCKNPYLTEFKAKILEKLIINGQYAIVLDNTAFYPTSGGQPNDLGYIQNVPIVDVIEDNEKVIHILKENIEEKYGDIVVGKINWKRRFDHMQQHTGQHLLSAILMNHWQKETLSFHMGRDICTLDIPFVSLDEGKVSFLEVIANQVIYENRPIRHYFTQNNSENSTEKLRKLGKKHKELRIIEIEKLDRTACGGTHCQHTGEIGMIKITGWENRKDKIRISFICGKRALADYHKKHFIIKSLSNFFTTGIDQLEEKIIKLSKENKELAKKSNLLEKKLITYEVEKLKQNIITDKNGFSIISKIYLEKNIQQLKQIAIILIKETGCLVIIGANKPEPVLCLACPQEYDTNLVELMKEITKEYGGKGGGTNVLVMSKFDRPKELEMAFKKVTEKISGRNI